MYKIFFLLGLSIQFSCDLNGQISPKNDISFEEYILNMEIIKRDEVTEKDFNKGKYIYKEVINKVKQDSLNFGFSDYWNLTIALLCLGESEDDIRTSFKKSYKLDPKSICTLLKFQQETSKNNFKKMSEIILDITEIMNNCNPSKNVKIKIDTEGYSKNNNLDYHLVELMSKIHEDDQKYRYSFNNYKKFKKNQHLLDKQNQIIIDSLFSRYNKYLGRSYVGRKFEHVMWAVIQHSNINTMKRYLPILYQAVKDKELPKGFLKMLIDRIYSIEQGYQIFGSQAGVDIANEKIQKKVIAEYNMDNL